MIQRIQTVYLILTTVLAVLFLSGNIVDFSAGFEHLTLGFRGIGNVPESGAAKIIKSLPLLSALMIVVPVLSTIIIFLYKKRSLQLRLTAVLIIVIIAETATVALYIHSIMNESGAEPVRFMKLVLPFLMLVLSVLAYLGIKKDDRIVKSYDRLR